MDKITINNVPNQNAIEWCSEYQNYKQKVNDRFNELNSKLSLLDKEKTDIEHAIELLSLNAIDLSKLMKKLKQILRDRRDVKNELDVLDLIRIKLKGHNISVNTNKIYSMRTTEEMFILNDAIEKHVNKWIKNQREGIKNEDN